LAGEDFLVTVPASVEKWVGRVSLRKLLWALSCVWVEMPIKFNHGTGTIKRRRHATE